MWPLVEHQIENAHMLATAEKGRPRSASLRRAVSTAYYAVFQAVCATCADALVGSEKPWELLTPVFRAPDHYRTAQALLQGPPATTPELQRLGLRFSELLVAREWAGYNPEPRPGYKAATNDSAFTREEALRLIESAAEAIEIIDGLDTDTRLNLALRLAVRTRK